MSRDLDDIIGLLKGSDPEIFPVFVAKELHKLPPVTFDHVDVTRLLRDILCLKNQICTLEERIVSSEEFNQLKSEVEHMKNASIIDDFSSNAYVNKKRGTRLQNSFLYDSGPIGLNYVPQYENIKSAVLKNNGQSSLERHSSPKAQSKQRNVPAVSFTRIQNGATDAVTLVEAASSTVLSNGARETDCTAEGETDSGSAGVGETEHREAPAGTAVSTLPAMSRQPGGADALDRSVTRNIRSPALCSISNVTSQQISACDDTLLVPRVTVKTKQVVKDDDSEWQIVRNKNSKRNYKLIGQRGCAVASEGKFKAAEIKVPLFISNVSKETCENDIINYIKEKTNEIVSLKKINMKQNKKYNAYKVYVSKSNLGLFLDDNFWPNGITFRRFVQFMYKTKPVVS
ncbi:hypothetical protein PYW08_002484 [Mythimna loreyi]|uniref:Uncharacterized protein n=1 Tax=Mythimna loreyi TaxID=667449 RepID=A0ACC2QK17_9NEOP|nr:hypothetical protein PYW08_002484 [Mythimna loreyi]